MTGFVVDDKVASKLATTTANRLRGSAKLYYGVVQHEDYKLARELHGPGKVVRGYPSKDTPMTPSVGFRVTLVNGALGNLSQRLRHSHVASECSHG